jgi:predicted O-linked N-acetylglucosamine transferase (SPINDLY family)
LLHRLGRLPEALDRYDRALDIDDMHESALLQSGHALESMGASSRALAIFERMLTRDPENAAAMAGVASCGLRLCDWERSERMLAALRARGPAIDALPAFLLFATDWSPAEVAESLRRRARSARWPSALPIGMRRASSNDRLRVAYLSPDFRTHPVAHALAGLIEQHDRSRIETVGVALSPGDDSPIERRLRTAFDGFIDAAAMSDRAVASLMRARGIDIAVDLAGLTSGSRPAIFALRAAPVQMNFLGYPGSMGFEFIDYLVADHTVIPAGEEAHHTERVLRMPTTYLPFDDGRVLEPFEGGRAAAGLPADEVVFCAFGSAFKITRPLFEVWMRLLQELPGGILWLRSNGPAVRATLERAASRYGIAPNRLHFAGFEPRMETHLARLALADIFLDTAPYNAHTTASEALWAGVPVVSCLGSAFAGRVGASLLTACGAPELVCSDLGAYHDRALELARSRQRRDELRARLRESSPRAFDTRQYARDFEELLFQVDPRGLS